MWENNIIEILEKFCKKLLGNFDWIILNKIFIEFKFVKQKLENHLEKLENFWERIWKKYEEVVEGIWSKFRIARKFEETEENVEKICHIL